MWSSTNDRTTRVETLCGRTFDPPIRKRDEASEAEQCAICREAEQQRNREAMAPLAQGIADYLIERRLTLVPEDFVRAALDVLDGTEEQADAAMQRLRDARAAWQDATDREDETGS